MSRALVLLLLCSCAAAGPRPPDGRLARAALDGNLDAFRTLLDQGADPDDRLGDIDPPLNYVDHQQWTALHAAAYRGHAEIVRLLLRAGANPALDDGHGATPLDHALQTQKDGETIPLMLIAGGAPVDTRVDVYIDDYGDAFYSALHTAAARGLSRVVGALLERGAYVHTRTTARWTPLFYARNPDVIRMLIGAGAGLEAKDRSGMTPLAFAIVRNQDEQAIAFLHAGANPNATWNRGDSPLHEALEEDRLPLIRALLDAGANPNAKTGNGRTPLQRVAGRFSPGAEEIGLLLLGKGARPAGGQTRWDIPLSAACMAGHARLVEAMLDRGADLHRTDEDGSTALHLACESAKAEVVRILVARGADLRVKNKEGETPVDAAKEQGIRDILLKDR